MERTTLSNEGVNKLDFIYTITNHAREYEYLRFKQVFD